MGLFTMGPISGLINSLSYLLCSLQTEHSSHPTLSQSSQKVWSFRSAFVKKEKGILKSHLHDLWSFHDKKDLSLPVYGWCIREKIFCTPFKISPFSYVSPPVSFLAQQTENDVCLIPLASFENLVMAFILSAVLEYLAFYILICLYYLRNSP